MATTESTRAGISFWTLIPFFAIAFGLGWGIVTLLIFFPDQTEAIFGPIWPDAQPWDTLVFAIAAVVIVMLNRRMMLTREGAVTDVLMPGK